MAKETVKYIAGGHPAFLEVALLGFVEQGDIATIGTVGAAFLPIIWTEAENLLRLLVPVMKAQCSFAAVFGLRACMESLGGAGCCEHNEDGGVLNVARIFRDTNVNAIWEGTTSVMADDVVRVLKGKGGLQALTSLEALVARVVEIARPKYKEECSVILAAWRKLKQDIEQSDAPKLQSMGRALLGGLEAAVCSLLLVIDAVMDHCPLAAAVLSRWLHLRYPQQQLAGRSGSGSDDLPDRCDVEFEIKLVERTLVDFRNIGCEEIFTKQCTGAGVDRRACLRMFPRLSTNSGRWNEVLKWSNRENVWHQLKHANNSQCVDIIRYVSHIPPFL